jgi:hypothetical protein
MAVILIHGTSHCQAEFVFSDQLFTGQKEREESRFAAPFPRVTMDFLTKLPPFSENHE